MLRFSAAFAARLRDAAPSCSSSLSASPDVSDVARPPVTVYVSRQTKAEEAGPPGAQDKLSTGIDGHQHQLYCPSSAVLTMCDPEAAKYPGLLVLYDKLLDVATHLTMRHGRQRALLVAPDPVVAARTAGRARPRGLSV